jgi:hypothetical protein
MGRLQRADQVGHRRREEFGGRPAGTITAALFLKEFAEGYPWVHLDIAGTAYTESDLGTVPRGPTGVPVGTFVGIRARAGALIARRLAGGKGRCWSMLGLGLLAGAFLQTPLRAQVRDTLPKKDTIRIPTAPTLADSLLRDSLAKRDSILRERIRADTIRSPLAHAPPGAELSIGRRMSWSRDSLLGTGAITVTDLVDRVPGATTTRGGWIASPAAGAYLGDARRVRVFYDGFEMPALGSARRQRARSDTSELVVSRGCRRRASARRGSRLFAQLASAHHQS